MLFESKKIISKSRENSNDKRQQAKGRKTEYFLGNGEIPHISSEIKPPLAPAIPNSNKGPV